MLLSPGMLSSGYVVKPSSTLHSRTCWKCDPKGEELTLIEQELWRKKFN